MNGTVKRQIVRAAIEQPCVLPPCSEKRFTSGRNIAFVAAQAIEETKMRWLENEALSFGYGEMTPLSAEKGIFHAVAAMTAKA